MVERLPFDLSETPRLGVIVLSTDETLEREWRDALAGHGITVLHSRIAAEPDVTPQALQTMAARMTQTAALLPQGLSTIAYACTSGATVIGPHEVARLVNLAHPGVPVTNPLSAVIAALQALNARRIGLVSPYVASVTAPLRAALSAAGIEVAREVSFDISHDQTVARITEASTRAAVARVSDGVDAVFCSCTNLRVFGLIQEAEATLGLPVISSNSALLWHIGQRAGLTLPGPGRLFQSDKYTHTDTHKAETPA